jgi:hypothetical protein
MWPVPMLFPGEFGEGLGPAGDETVAGGPGTVSPSTVRALGRYSMLRLAVEEKASGLSRVVTPTGRILGRVSRLIPSASETLGL